MRLLLGLCEYAMCSGWTIKIGKSRLHLGTRDMRRRVNFVHASEYLTHHYHIS